MKSLLLSLSLLALSGCASITGYNFEPDNVESASALISYQVDEFDEVARLKTEPVVNMDHANAIYHLRAYVDLSNEVKNIQVYVNLRVSTWYFISDAAMKSESISLTKIDREVVSGGYVHEDVAVNISKETLERMAEKDTLIKLKGKRGDYVFSVSKNMSEAFLSNLESRLKI